MEKTVLTENFPVPFDFWSLKGLVSRCRQILGQINIIQIGEVKEPFWSFVVIFY